MVLAKTDNEKNKLSASNLDSGEKQKTKLKILSDAHFTTENINPLFMYK